MIPKQGCGWDDDRIEQYSRQTLPPEEAARLEEHLLVCESCQARLAAEDAYAHAMRHAALQLYREPEESERGYPLPWFFRPLAVVAMLLLMAAAGWHWVRSSAPVPAVAISLEALRGSQPGSKAPAGRPLALQADLSGLPAAASYPLQLVDRDGRAVWKGSTSAATIPPQLPGQYFLRVYSAEGELLREYGLDVEAR